MNAWRTPCSKIQKLRTLAPLDLLHGGSPIRRATRLSEIGSDVELSTVLNPGMEECARGGEGGLRSVGNRSKVQPARERLLVTGDRV